MLLKSFLSGGDLRSLGNSNYLVQQIITQTDFDKLFKLLFSSNRLIVMRAADVIEKITLQHPEYIAKHKVELLQLLNKALNKELLWHIIQIVPRLQLSSSETAQLWKILKKKALDNNNSKIVRVNTLQSLFEISQNSTNRQKELLSLFKLIESENIPSLNARIKKLQKTIIQ